jgi:hypothetical protein
MSILYAGIVFGGPGAYTVYLSIKESQVSGILARRRAAKRARESALRRKQAWEVKGRRQAAALEAWRSQRDLSDRASA